MPCAGKGKLDVFGHELVKGREAVESSRVRYFLAFPGDWQEGIPQGFAKWTDKLLERQTFRMVPGNLLGVASLGGGIVYLKAGVVHDMTAPGCHWASGCICRIETLAQPNLLADHLPTRRIQSSYRGVIFACHSKRTSLIRGRIQARRSLKNFPDPVRIMGIRLSQNAAVLDKGKSTIDS